MHTYNNSVTLTVARLGLNADLINICSVTTSPVIEVIMRILQYHNQRCVLGDIKQQKQTSQNEARLETKPHTFVFNASE